MAEQLSLLSVRRRRIMLSISKADKSKDKSAPAVKRQLEEHLRIIDEQYRFLLSSLQPHPV